MKNENKVVATVPSVFFVAWIVMLTLGALHLDVDSRIPHPSYLLTLLMLWSMTLIGAMLRGSR